MNMLGTKPVRAGAQAAILLLLFAVIPAEAAKSLKQTSVKGGEVSDAEVGSSEGDVPENSPVGKILSLLAELRSQLTEDAAADSQHFGKYSTWYVRARQEANITIKNTKDTISSLDTALQEQSALQQEQTLEVDRASADLTQAEQDLQQATSQRESEHANFTTNEREATQAIEHLEHAIRVMHTTPDATEAVQTTSLVDVARKVRAVLLQGKDFSLSLAQRATLDEFLRAAAHHHRGGNPSSESAAGIGGSLRGGAGEALAPDFLQFSERGSGASLETQGGSGSGGVISTLRSVLEKAEAHRTKLREDEKSQRETFEQFSKDSKQQIASINERLKAAKQQISDSQERSGKMQADLLAARELLQVTNAGLAEVEADFAAKNTSYHERDSKRNDEIMAVEEASEIMNGPEMAKVMAEHYNKTSPSAGTDSSPSFLQQQSSNQREVLPGTRAFSDASLVELDEHGADEPFAKVIQLIREMVQRLEQEANKEATKAQYCETELSTSARSEKKIRASSQKLRARISEIDADVEQLEADIKRIMAELQDMTLERNEATRLRTSEHEMATTSVARYKDAQRLLGYALTALRRVYGEEDSSHGSSDSQGSGYKVSGAGAGVIGLLEIAIEDFAQLEQETATAERTAQSDYTELMDSTEVKTKAFQKDLDYKNRQKVKLESMRMRAMEDLQSFDKELAALTKYIDQLKAQCVRIETHEERQAHREEEIRQLEEALAALGGPAR